MKKLRDEVDRLKEIVGEYRMKGDMEYVMKERI